MSGLWNVYAHMLFYECVFYCIFDILLYTHPINIFGWEFPLYLSNIETVRKARLSIMHKMQLVTFYWEIIYLLMYFMPKI
jgi:hypothetical protein